nr:CAP domain-containing protein [Robertkochia sp. 3YJGBD-33]
MILCLCCYSCANESITETENLYVASLEDVSLQNEVFELINEHRISISLNPLKNLDIVYAKAEEHTNYMIATQEANHDYFFEREAYLKSNANAALVAENVAFAYTTATGVVNGWLNSEQHRAVIEGDFTHASISARKDKEGNFYFTHIFIKRLEE